MSEMQREAARTTTRITLAGLYLLLFAYIGVYMPWIPPLLESRGFDVRMIGVGLALVSVSRVALPPLWGLLADRMRARRRILSSCAMFAGAAMVAQAAGWSPAARMFWLFVHGFFLVPLFPLLDALTLAVLGGGAERYGRVRLWGSIGFIVASLGAGALVHRAGIGVVPWLAGLPLLVGAILVPLLGEAASDARAAPSRRRERDASSPPMPWRRLAPVIAAATLGQASHGPYYAFFTLQMDQRGLDPEWIGALWAWGVAAEVALMAVSPLLLRRISLAAAFRAALSLSAVRWLLYSTEPATVVIVAGQAMHAASFGLLHVATVQLVDRISPAARKTFGQSILSASAYGGGIGAGLFAAGLLAARLSAGGLYIVAALLSLAGLAIAARLIGSREGEPAERRDGSEGQDSTDDPD
jgi:PPP family 3-phenylpropionic acid transporter